VHLRTTTQHQRTADAYFTWLSTLIALRKSSRDDHRCDHLVHRAAGGVQPARPSPTAIFDCRPLVVGKPDCLLPMAPRVDAGTQVGPDRLVNTAGAFDRHGGDLIVVDFGTATTFDVVAHDGAYVGGVIAPGVNLSLEALHMAAAALPHVDVTKPQKRDRHQHRGLHAIGHLLGLCRPCARHL
jgi:type III pantothenate kinase